MPDLVSGREVNKVLPPWLHRDVLVPNHQELRRLADEQLNRCFAAAQGCLRMMCWIEDLETASSPLPLLGLHLTN